MTASHSIYYSDFLLNRNHDEVPACPCLCRLRRCVRSFYGGKALKGIVTSSFAAIARSEFNLNATSSFVFC